MSSVDTMLGKRRGTAHPVTHECDAVCVCVCIHVCVYFVPIAHKQKTTALPSRHGRGLNNVHHSRPAVLFAHRFCGVLEVDHHHVPDRQLLAGGALEHQRDDVDDLVLVELSVTHTHTQVKS